MARILLLDGHPDADRARFVHALADAYATAAAEAGHDVRRVELATLDVPLLRRAADWEEGTPPPAIADAQRAIAWAEHLVILYPLWLGDMPALLKGFLEQTLRPGFAIARGARTLNPGLLRGRTARVVVTMGMPGFVYRWYFRAHGLKLLERNILKFCGIGPVRSSVVGNVMSESSRMRALRRMAALGARAG